MNERIKELLEQTDIPQFPILGSLAWVATDHDMEKFAELIIQECIDACIEADGIKYITPPSQGQVVFDCVREIKQRWS